MLYGREREVAEACALLARPEIRLLTLLGPGGVGKTRQAQQIATVLLASFLSGSHQWPGPGHADDCPSV